MLDYIDLRKKMRKGNVFAGSEEIARGFFKNGQTPKIWQYTIKVHFEKNKFQYFKLPKETVVYLKDTEIRGIDILKNNSLSVNSRAIFGCTKFFETKEECFKQFAIDLAKAKKVIEAELDKTVFNKIREGENLLS